MDIDYDDKTMKNELEELFLKVKNSINGEIKWDKATRVLYSTDASIYQIEPLAVVFPKTLDDINTCVSLAAEYRVPVLARGAGSSLAGQAVGQAVIIDCSRYLYRGLSIDPESHRAIVDAGVVLASLNRKALQFDLEFGPDPASAERATLGGSIANNATGAHSILYGMAADHVCAVEVVLSDGSLARFETISIAEAVRRSQGNSLESSIYRSALRIRNDFASAIMSHWPKTWRRAGGYNLNYLIPWSPSRPPMWKGSNCSPQYDGDPPDGGVYPPVAEGFINLAPLIAGSEGTLAIIRRCELNLVTKPRYSALAVLGFKDVRQACEQVEALLEFKPSAIELIPSSLIRLAGQIPAYAQQLSWIEPLKEKEQIPTLLAVEFSGDDPKMILNQAERLIAAFHFPGLIINSKELQKQVWGVRKVGLGILMSIPGDEKPVPFIEDISVPIESLSTFVDEMNRLLEAYNSQGDFYAHASAGCLHLRPLLNLKTSEGIWKMREIARQAVDLVVRLGGSVSGEHGAGLSRSEWLPLIYGPEVMTAFQLLKSSADPDNILNPGKIIGAPPMQVNLRHIGMTPEISWKTVFDFSYHHGILGAIEMCNGAGVCRKEDGVMCPSYQITRDEMHSPRGRANLLRSWMNGDLTTEEDEVSQILFEALDLCLACKGCKAECPSAVDIAKLKYEFLEYYYSTGKRRLLRDLLFANIDRLGLVGIALQPFGNLIMKIFDINLVKGILGLAEKRKFPALDNIQLTKKMERYIRNSRGLPKIEEVLLFIDPYNEYFHTEVGMDALKLLDALGIETRLIPIIGSGRPRISKGLLKSAWRHAEAVLSAIDRVDPEGNIPIIGLEPSEIYTLADEYLDFFPEKRDLVRSIADRTYLIDEFLIRPGDDGKARLLRIGIHYPRYVNPSQNVYLHGHCYQKARPPHRDGMPIGVDATRMMLEMMGYQVEVIEAGCCGMAGAFGYEREHYDLSQQIGELSLFPTVRNAEQGALIAAAGFSCQTQITEGTGRKVWHPVQLAAACLQ